MIGDRYAADFRQTLVDLQIAAIAAKECKRDRGGIVDQLKLRGWRRSLGTIDQSPVRFCHPGRRGSSHRATVAGGRPFQEALAFRRHSRSAHPSTDGNNTT